MEIIPLFLNEESNRSPPSTPPPSTPPQTLTSSTILNLRNVISPPTPSPSPQPFSINNRRYSQTEWSPALNSSLTLNDDDDHDGFIVNNLVNIELNEVEEEEKLIELITLQFLNLTTIGKEKLLNSLVDNSPSSFLSSLLSKVTLRLKKDFLKSLPIELSFHVLSFVDDVKTLQRASEVSKFWRNLMSDETTWKRLCWVSGFGTDGKISSNNNHNNNNNNNNQNGGNYNSGEINLGSERMRSLEFGEREIEIDESSTPAGRERRLTLDKENTINEFNNVRAELFGLRINEIEPVLSNLSISTHQEDHVIPDTTTSPSIASTSTFTTKPFESTTPTLTRRKSSKSSTSKLQFPSPTPSTSSSSFSPNTTPSQPFSYKSHFKRAYLSETNWLKGPGRLLSTQMATENDGVVTSLGYDNEWMVVGMATSKVHIFDAEDGTYRRTLEGHDLGVWCLTLVSKTKPSTGKGKETAETEDNSWPSNNDSSSGLSAPLLSIRRSADSPNPISNLGVNGLFSNDSIDTSNLFYPRVDSNFNSTTTSNLSQSQNSASTPSSTSSSARPRRQSFHGSEIPSINSNNSSSSSAKAKSSGMGIGAGGATGDAGQSGPCGTARGFGNTTALIVSAGCDRDVRVWNAESGECLHILRGHSSTVRCMRVIDGRPIAISGSRDATLRVWNIETGESMHVLSGHDASVRCIEVSGNKVVSGSYDSTCRLWDVDTGECLFVFRGHDHQIYSCAFDGLRVVTGSLDSTVRIWDATTGAFLALLQGHTSLVGQLQLDPISNILITGGSDGRVIVFNVVTFETYHRLCAHDNSVTCLQFDDRFIVTGGNDGAIMLWDFKTGAFIRELAERCDAVWKVVFREDKCVILCRRDGKTLMDVRTFRPLEEA